VIPHLPLKVGDFPGMTYDLIGELVGITKARVYQILKGQSGDTGKYYSN
jgi:hypothetical protein